MKSFLAIGCVTFACLAVTRGSLYADSLSLEGNWRLVSAEPALPSDDRYKELYERAGINFGRSHDETYDYTQTGACNSWSSHFGFKSGTPQFNQGPVTSTAQYCPDERADFDRAFSRAMRLTDSMTITGDTLHTEGGGGKLVFQRRR